MNDAKKLAILRFALAGAGIAAPIVVGIALRFVPVHITASAAMMIASTVAGGVLFFYFTFRWRPRCPQCKGGRASFVRTEQDKELLVCSVCSYREATGWVYGES